MTTFNSADKDADITLSGGDLVAALNSTSTNGCVRATTSKSTGKAFFESTVTVLTAGGSWRLGLMLATDSLNVQGPASSAGGIEYADGGDITGPLISDEGDGFTTGDVIGVAVDFDADLIWFSKNGVWQLGGDSRRGHGRPSHCVEHLLPGVGRFSCLSANYWHDQFWRDCLYHITAQRV